MLLFNSQKFTTSAQEPKTRQYILDVLKYLSYPRINERKYKQQQFHWHFKQFLMWFDIHRFDQVLCQLLKSVITSGNSFHSYGANPSRGIWRCFVSVCFQRLLLIDKGYACALLLIDKAESWKSILVQHHETETQMESKWHSIQVSINWLKQKIIKQHSQHIKVLVVLF